MRNLINMLGAVSKNASINLKDFRAALGYCPVCMAKTPLIKLKNSEMSIRCLCCRSSAVTMSLVSVLHSIVKDLRTKDVYEMSSRGPLCKYLENNSKRLTVSEFFDQVPPGAYYNSIQCQDVQKLTYPDQSFDICTSTEVFEHVPDDLKGFSEIFRTLRPGGWFIFTVPLHDIEKTVERAKIAPDGSIEHILPPEYHVDPLRQHDSTLVFRDYGLDIVQRLTSRGFCKAEIIHPGDCIPWGFGRKVVAGRKSDYG